MVQERYWFGERALKLLERAKEIADPSSIATLGAGIGLLSLFLPWAGRAPNPFVGLPTISPQLYDQISHRFPYATQYSFLDILDWNLSLKFCLIVFVAGTVLGMVTRIGGLVQAIGLLGFGIEFGDFIAGWRQAHTSVALHFEFYLGTGCLLAAISTFTILFVGRKRALENPACGCVPCLMRVSALSPFATRIRT